MRFTLARRVFIAILLFDVAVNLARFPILTWKAEEKDFAVLVFNENAHFQWIWSDNFWSRDSAPPMAVGEKHRLYNKQVWWAIFITFTEEGSIPLWPILLIQCNVWNDIYNKQKIALVFHLFIYCICWRTIYPTRSL